MRDLTVTGVQTCALPTLRLRVVGVVGPSPFELRNRRLGGRLLDVGEHERAGLLRPTHDPVEPEVDEPGLPSRGDRGVLLRHPGTEVRVRSEEHTSELQSQSNLVCRLLLEKKKTLT